MTIDLLADAPEGVDLLADDPMAKPAAKQKSFYDLSKEDQAKALDMARQQISAQYPDMPDWLRDMMLKITPKDASPRLKKIADFAEANTNAIPVAAGGLLQGAATPFQGIASMIPGKTAENFANEDFTRFTPQPQNGDEENLQTGAKLVGSLGPLGKLFGMLKGGTQLARVPKALQNAAALTGTGAIATPGDTGDKALGAAGALALGGAGKLAGQVGSAVGTKIPAFLRGLTNESTPKSLAEAIQKPHDILENTADTLYDQVRNAIKRRNVKVNVNPATLNEISEYPSMQTKTHKELIDAAKSGDYDAIHKLQSSLYKKGSKDMLNDDSVVETRGENLMDLRQRINKELEGSLIQQGHIDIAHVLRQGKDIYKKIQDTYFNKDLRSGGGNAIGKLVHKDLRIMPKDATALVDTNSKPMNAFLKQHPEAARHAQGIKEKEAAKNALGKIFGTSAKIGGSAYLGKSLFDFLS